MGGDDSQKLLPWRGMLLLSRAQTSGSLRNQHCNGNGATGFAPASSESVAQLQTAWVIFGKHRWVRNVASAVLAGIVSIETAHKGRCLGPR